MRSPSATVTRDRAARWLRAADRRRPLADPWRPLVIAEIALGGSLLTSVGLSAWLAVKAFRAVERAAFVDSERTRLAFEIEVTTKALAEEQRRNRILTEALHAEFARNPHSDLDSDDVAGRLRRIAASFGADDDLPPVVDSRTVSASPATGKAAPGAVSGEFITELR
jgi:hypothetical protein